jgi:hypothetical protein
LYLDTMGNGGTMKSYMLALTGLVFTLSCSSQGGEQRVQADDDLAPPLEVARVDTSQPIAAVEQQPKAPASPEAKPATALKEKPAPKKARRAPRNAPVDTAVTLAARSKEDTSPVQGYAPNVEADSARVDTAVADTVVADTALPVVSAAEATAPIADTVPSSVIDSAVASRTPVDTVASAPRDTTSPAVTDTSTAVPDTAMARDSVPTSPAPASAATANGGAFSSSAAQTLPVGTEIHAALDDSINSRKDTVGRTVTAVVMENITGSDGKTLIAAGTPIRMTVTRLSPARSKSAQGRIRLKVAGIGMGQQLSTLSAEVQAVPHELRGRGVTAGDAAKVGVGAAAGAVAGKVIGKNTKGAVIGGVIGAAGGAVVASQTATRDVFVKARTPVTLKLTHPLVVVR